MGFQLADKIRKINAEGKAHLADFQNVKSAFTALVFAYEGLGNSQTCGHFALGKTRVQPETAEEGLHFFLLGAVDTLFHGGHYKNS